MTAFAFILGCVPLWVAAGAGAISRQVLGTVVIGGMLASSIIAIFFVPVSFDVVERFGNLFSKKKERPQQPPAVGAGPEGGSHDAQERLHRDRHRVAVLRVWMHGGAELQTPRRECPERLSRTPARAHRPIRRVKRSRK